MTYDNHPTGQPSDQPTDQPPVRRARWGTGRTIALIAGIFAATALAVCVVLAAVGVYTGPFIPGGPPPGTVAARQTADVLSPESTCAVVVPALDDLVVLFTELVQTGRLSDSQHVQAEVVQRRLTPVTGVGHPPWRADIEVQRKAAEFAVTDRIVDPVEVRDSGLRLLRACAAYGTR